MAITSIVDQVEANDQTSSGSFTFTALDKGFESLKTPEAAELLNKWNLDEFMRSKVFRFDQAFSVEQIDAFLLDFFASPAVQEAAPVCVGTGGHWSTLGEVKPGAVKHQRLATTVLRLDFFDRLREARVVIEGDIAKCLDVQCGEVLVSDRLRRLMLDDEDEGWDLFSEAERSELIFHIVKRLAIGGGMNQYEDKIDPYLNMTRALYKDLVSVQKTKSGTLAVSSLTYAISDVAGSSASLFPRPSPHNFCYVTVDPLARRVKLWYGAWFPMM
mmetsp:Transcript_43601/g.87249  ORF Transcript_43601/g.87249 Transcript_43601/m.87249 type:complete len:272 (-) Transcript_43601:389-1204(-)|eukprot:CAMPEP_0174715840 /NCGR_PEP_ID=MMETSP1094-20130205/22643_1 /TAXON_ID=156173 /ORGANISM="Chrysochromulina brevifilum, Strain UTEX LB 985" /LENGTH=271 /DNA_ID=CAMNT_0015915499 /DNA_START=47 /DNA_END=862 /DNA_ORIENTATION=+